MAYGEVATRPFQELGCFVQLLAIFETFRD